jgi:hypothetical protein
MRGEKMIHQTIVTEAQAQELANFTGCYITSDLFGCALIHGRTPKKGITSWHSPFLPA